MDELATMVAMNMWYFVMGSFVLILDERDNSDGKVINYHLVLKVNLQLSTKLLTTRD